MIKNLIIYIIILVLISGHSFCFAKEKSEIENFVQKYVNKVQKDTYRCKPGSPECKGKYWNYYSSILGGPFFYFDGAYLGYTLDFVPLGIQITNGRETRSFEAKFFNQFFVVDSTKVNAKESFDLDANLHGVQLKYIKGKKLKNSDKIKTFRFAGIDLGYARMKGVSESDGEFNFAAPTFGFAVGIGIEYELSHNLDIGFEVPFGVTMLYHSQTGLQPFPDIFPNVSLKYHF